MAYAGLNVDRCLELQALAKEVGILAGFGVGTHLTNDFACASDASRKSRALNMVLKLDSINGHPTVKISDELTKNTGDADEIAYVVRLTQPCQAPLWSVGCRLGGGCIEVEALASCASLDRLPVVERRRAWDASFLDRSQRPCSQRPCAVTRGWNLVETNTC